jgi:vacuolar-type H+-ATPase subunit F/Vma7
MKSYPGQEKEKPRDRVVVLTDPETAEGFNLGGVDVYSFRDVRKAREKIQLLLTDERTKVLVVNNDFLKDVDDWARRIIESPAPPVVVSLPTAETGYGRERRSSLLRVIHRATSQM